MFCKHCGAELEDSAKFCKNCGAAVDRPAADVQQPYYAPQPQTVQPTNTIAIVGFILSFFVSVAGLVCSIIGYRNAPLYNGNGKGLALAGIIISAVSLALTVILVIVYAGIIFAAIGIAY